MVASQARGKGGGIKRRQGGAHERERGEVEVGEVGEG